MGSENNKKERAIQKRESLGIDSDEYEGLRENSMYTQNPNVYLDNDVVDFIRLFRVLWSGKWIVLASTIFFTSLSIIFSLSLPNVYRSDTLLAPVEEADRAGFAGLASQFGGLASLAGVSLGGGGDNTALAIEIIRSREFISKFIKKYELMVPLIASEGWDPVSKKLVINPSVYDEEANQWVRSASPPKKAEPSDLEGYEAFRKKLAVTQDKKNGFVTVSIEHYSPKVAKQWVSLIVLEINNEIRKREVLEAKKSINYLNEQLEKTSIADMQRIFFELVEEQSKIVMFANVREEYAFKTIDPAFAPEKKVKPKRAVLCMVGMMLGALFGSVCVVVREGFR